MHIGIPIGLFVLSYLAQLLLCFKTKNKHIKLIPFYIGLAIAFLGLLVYAELFGDMSGGFLGNVHYLVAIIIWIAVLVIYIALFLAKITHITVKAIQRRNDK